MEQVSTNEINEAIKNLRVARNAMDSAEELNQLKDDLADAATNLESAWKTNASESSIQKLKSVISDIEAIGPAPVNLIDAMKNKEVSNNPTLQQEYLGIQSDR